MKKYLLLAAMILASAGASGCGSDAKAGPKFQEAPKSTIGAVDSPADVRPMASVERVK